MQKKKEEMSIQSVLTTCRKKDRKKKIPISTGDNSIPLLYHSSTPVFITPVCLSVFSLSLYYRLPLLGDRLIAAVVLLTASEQAIGK
jgi:hypothetical protein